MELSETMGECSIKNRMMIVTMTTQTLPLMRMKAANSGKRYRVLMNGFQISNLNY